MNRVLRRGMWICLGAAVCACEAPSSSESAEAPSAEAHGHEHGSDNNVVTTWNDDTELFVEFPPLVVGHDAGFAAHLTWLEDFGPVDSGRVTVVLSGGGVADERFTVGPSSTAGIFRPIVTPTQAAERAITLVLQTDDRRSEHSLGTFEVASSPETAAAAKSEDGGSITLLKEQQWKMSFSTQLVATRALRPSFRAFAQLVPRADGEVLVSAPATGRLIATRKALPVVGSEVSEGDVLARFVPRLEGTADVASLDLAVAAARLDVDHSVRERERLEKLFADGAVPERRVAEARHAEATARAALKAAQRRTGQFRRVQRTGARGTDSSIEVRTPLSGTVLEVHAVAGALVEDGAALFRVVDETSLWLSAKVPEVDAGKIGEVRGAWFRAPGVEAPIDVGSDALVTRGGRVDPQTRTVDVVFVVPNQQRMLRVGAAVDAHLVVGEPDEVPCVPAQAVLVDAGMEVVFVQTGGESFERRQVRTGMRDADLVEIVEGVSEGERVVVDGAYLVALASASTDPPAHGHAH